MTPILTALVADSIKGAAMAADFMSTTPRGQAHRVTVAEAEQQSKARVVDAGCRDS